MFQTNEFDHMTSHLVNIFTFMIQSYFYYKIANKRIIHEQDFKDLDEIPAER